VQRNCRIPLFYRFNVARLYDMDNLLIVTIFILRSQYRDLRNSELQSQQKSMHEILFSVAYLYKHIFGDTTDEIICFSL